MEYNCTNRIISTWTEVPTNTLRPTFLALTAGAPPWIQGSTCPACQFICGLPTNFEFPQLPFSATWRLQVGLLEDWCRSPFFKQILGRLRSARSRCRGTIFAPLTTASFIHIIHLYVNMLLHNSWIRGNKWNGDRRFPINFGSVLECMSLMPPRHRVLLLSSKPTGWRIINCVNNNSPTWITPRTCAG